MKGYVKFSDGHMEQILDGYAFDDPQNPRSLYHIIAETKSGCYRKTIHKDSKFKPTGTVECVGYGLANQTPRPVATIGHNGVVDVVIHDQSTYKYELEQDGWKFSGVVVVPEDADIRDVHSAIMREFDRARIIEIGR